MPKNPNFGPISYLVGRKLEGEWYWDRFYRSEENGGAARSLELASATYNGLRRWLFPKTDEEGNPIPVDEKYACEAAKFVMAIDMVWDREQRKFVPDLPEEEEEEVA